MNTQPLLLDLGTAGPRFAVLPAAARSVPKASAHPSVPARPRQPGLTLRMASEVSLIDLQTVRALRGIDAESVLALIDAGQIRWVWDVALPGKARRELRFLTAEARGEAGPLTEAQAIDAAIGVPATRARLRAAEIEQRWVISNQTVMRLGRAGVLAVQMEGHTKWVVRESLVRFLASRRVGE